MLVITQMLGQNFLAATAAVTDMYVNGVSTRKVKDALKSVAGEKIRMSKSTVSRITKSKSSTCPTFQ
jgi:transposase-like protein